MACVFEEVVLMNLGFQTGFQISLLSVFPATKFLMAHINTAKKGVQFLFSILVQSDRETPICFCTIGL